MSTVVSPGGSAEMLGKINQVPIWEVSTPALGVRNSSVEAMQNSFAAQAATCHPRRHRVDDYSAPNRWIHLFSFNTPYRESQPMRPRRTTVRPRNPKGRLHFHEVVQPRIHFHKGQHGRALLMGFLEPVEGFLFLLQTRVGTAIVNVFHGSVLGTDNHSECCLRQ
jgi:hypothetical protein